MNTSSLVASSFLFRLSITCRYTELRWKKIGVDLGPEFTIPSFRAELDAGPLFAELRMGWNEDGLLIWMRTNDKKQAPWCRENRLEDSDGLNILIDTRNTQNIHRASRFCHRFVFLPQGAGRLLDEPVCTLLAINRAKEHAKPVPPKTLKLLTEKRHDGYVLKAHIPAEAMTGWEPNEHPRLGFFYAVTDRELGWQTFSLGPEMPFASDPSLWGTLELAY